MLEFENLYYFLLIIPVIILILFFYLIWWKNIIFSDNKILKKVFKTSTIYYKLYYIIIFLICILFVWIFANLIIKYEQDEILENWVDIEIVLDISYSMMAEDFSPNRLEASKKIINNFLEKVEHDRVWLVVFAWKAFTSLPLNFDYEISQNIINDISVDTINQNYYWMQGTAIWDALVIASNWFWEDSEDREKIIILLTDWDANVWLDPSLAVDYFKNQWKNIKIYTIWIWWEGKAYITQTDVFWRTQKQEVAWLNEKTLKQIASASSWEYFRATNEKTLEKIFDNISKLEKKDITKDTLTIKKEKNIYLINLLILFFTLFFILKYKKNL